MVTELPVAEQAVGLELLDFVFQAFLGLPLAVFGIRNFVGRELLKLFAIP